MVACVAGLAIANPRTIFAFARDGLLPSALARLRPRTRTPGIAIALNAALFALLAIGGEFAPLAAASSLASMSVYVIGAAAFFVLRRRGVTQAGPVLAFAAAPIAGAVAIGANLAIILGASGRELGALAAAIAAFVLLAVVRTRRPALAGA